MQRPLPTVTEEKAVTDFSKDSDENLTFNGSNDRLSLDSLNSSWRNENEGSVSLSLNDDLVSRNGSNSVSRRSFESSSIFTSSFRQSLDDSLPTLHLNKLSIQQVSPLGPNSVYELVAGADAKKHKPSSLGPNGTKTRSKLHIPPPTSYDIPIVRLSKLEKPPKETLKQYLNDIGEQYEKYTSNKQLTPSALQSLFTKESSDDDHDLLATNSNDLNEVPSIFFREEFNLDDPSVFHQVTEGNDLKNLNDVLQEKISSHLDTIEIHLVNEISKSSNSFFDALNDLNDINTKNERMVNLIDKLKSQTRLLKENKIQAHLDILKSHQKVQNISNIEQGLLQIKTILQTTKVTNELFLKGKYEDCLEKIDEIESLIQGESSKLSWHFSLQNLQGIGALSKVQEELRSLRYQTGQSYSKVFVDYLLGDLRAHYEDIDFPKTLNRLMDGSSYQIDISDDFRHQLRGYVIGLAKSEAITSAFHSYEEQFINDMKNIVRIYLPNEESTGSLDDSSSAVSSSVSKPSGKSLSTLIKALSPRDFEDMLLKIYSTASEGLRRLTAHQKILLDLSLNNVKDTGGDLIMSLDIRNAINKAAEIIQIRMGKIINVRRDLNSNLRFDYFLRFYFINSIFLNECESISGLNFKFLPDIINAQIKQFNSTFHQNNLKQISHSINIEEWKPLIVPSSLQLVADDIVDNKDLDEGRKWKNGLMHLRSKHSETEKTKEESSHKRSIVIGDKTFVANHSLLVLVNIIKDILILTSNFQNLSSLYEANIIELLKYYNVRVMQSIKKPDGTLDREKNLSVVGESLDCIQEVIHYIRISFDKLEHDEDYEKLVELFVAAKGKIDSINTIFE